nr:transmembrane protein 120B isoform X3 [Loxodonta africana]
MSGQLERCEREWHELEGEFQELQETHKIYKQKLEEVTALQTLCSGSINKQKKRLKDLKYTLQRYKCHASQEEVELVQQMSANIRERQNIFFDMEAYLPKKNGFAYKDEYEKFKLYLTIILLLGAVACRFVLHYRVTDEIFNFLLVWYYCTLTIRESILISNGSRSQAARQRPWCSENSKYQDPEVAAAGLVGSRIRRTRSDADLAQRTYLPEVSQSVLSVFYFSELCAVPTVLLPEGLPVPAACPGRAESPGPHEGFQSWMWRGLTFLLPFLFCGHFWQLYNAVTLFELSSHKDCQEWQVFVLALTFLVLFLGNFLTTLKVVHAKLQKNRNKTKQP